jgi:DNA-directed RNA polymerase specialized sigma24 family protein
VRLAVELFVVERMAAADVARVVGWPNAKAVYNRVYRVLMALRAELHKEGIGPGDL